MAARAASTETYWRNLLGFRAEAKSEYDAGVKRIEQQRKQGSLGETQAGNAIAALEKDYKSRLKAISEGPTQQLLNREYETQRAFAEENYKTELVQAEREFYQRNPKRYELTYADNSKVEDARFVNRGTVGGDLQEQPFWEAGKASGGTVVGGDLQEQPSRENYTSTRGKPTKQVQTSPVFQGQAFKFPGSADEYFASQFGTDYDTGGAAPSIADSGLSDARRAADSASKGEAIGVGNIYRWY